MGSVWVARHMHLDAVVAVKFMAPEYAASADARLRFEREAKASAQIKSPHVVHVYDFGVEGDTPFLAMELLDGEDLGNRLKREGRLSLKATSAILSQVCKGLRRAHESSIIHRDLKPGNIFLQRQDDDEIVKILDFGIAKILGPSRIGEETKTGLVVGSLRYMSPEQLQSSKRVDHRSDLWSLGVILYRCLTGKLPFNADEMADVVIQILRDPIPAPSSIAPELSTDVDDFFKRVLERDREKRFQSARELAEAFIALGGDRLSVEWTEVAPSLLLHSGQPRSEIDPTAKLTQSDGATAVHGAPPGIAAPQNPKITLSDMPTAIRRPIAPPSGSTGTSLEEQESLPQTASLDGTLAPIGRSEASWHTFGGSRLRSAMIAGAVACLLAAVITTGALVAGRWTGTGEAASGAPVLKMNAAPSIAAPAISSPLPEAAPVNPVLPAAEVGTSAAASAAPTTSSRSKTLTRPPASVREPPAKPAQDATREVLGF
jgi:serine/threonine-protein kinase